MKQKYPFLQIDVFTTRPLEGNPCAIVFEAEDLNSELMLAIAKEMNLSETVFVRKSTDCDYRVFYYTPKEEIPLAGHPTIATAHALVETGRVQLEHPQTTIILELTAGRIRVDIDQIDGRVEYSMYQLKPEFLKIYSPEVVMPLFGLEPGDTLSTSPIQSVSTGTPMLMVPVKSLEALKKAEMRIPEYIQFKNKGDFFSPHLFTLESIKGDGDTFARHFGTPPDTYEDSFTGSASGCMAAYIWHHGLSDKPVLVADQGHWMGRPGRGALERVGPSYNIESVKLTGEAITIIQGELTV